MIISKEKSILSTQLKKKNSTINNNRLLSISIYSKCGYFCFKIIKNSMVTFIKHRVIYYSIHRKE